jgi:hypothetical protein
MPWAETLPIFRVTPGWFVFATLQFTGTDPPVEVVAVQAKVFPETTVVAGLPEGSLQVTAAMAVGWTMVRFCVAVKVDCTCEVAVIVTTLLVGTVPGAVYNPPLEIDPVPVPPTDQFTSVLLRFKTVAVH